jgi:beta-lactamase regulating signal transducer with metallopeptidase domain
MITSFMVHACMVAACCAAAAWAAEHALAFSGRPRRLAWIAAMFLSAAIPAVALLVPDRVADAVPALTTMASAPVAVAAFTTALAELPAVTTGAPWEHGMAVGWTCMSLLFVFFHATTAWRLSRRARQWKRDPERENVYIARDIGPAVFGWIRPRVVLPRWLGVVPESMQRLVLEHERQHIAARDPQLLGTALLMSALQPWNIPLLWQLRRLRLALELDCDARVLAADVDPVEYGEALLLVNQRNVLAPAGAIALIERPSQLERRIRIMTATAQRFRKPLAALAVACASTCLFAATSITAPALATGAPLKPRPTGASSLQLGHHFEKLLADRFPDLLERDHERMPMVVVLLNDDWSIARAAQVISGDDLPVDEGTFGVIGMAREDVPYVGNMGMQSPHNPKHVVLMVFTERKTPGTRFVSHVFPDTRALDREIFRHYFPQAAQSGVPAGQQPWVLLDREGHVLRSGQDGAEGSELKGTLESRFPGIKTQEITVTPITDDSGEPLLDSAHQELQLRSVWLAADSPKP